MLTSVGVTRKVRVVPPEPTREEASQPTQGSGSGVDPGNDTGTVPSPAQGSRLLRLHHAGNSPRCDTTTYRFRRNHGTGRRSICYSAGGTSRCLLSRDGWFA